jgi:hypothetical protein
MRVLLDAFWLVVLGVIGLFAFFVALGAFAPGEVAVVSIGVVVLTALWLAHAALAARQADTRDPATVRARERRGF